MHVVVIGGGVIGVCCAYYLAKRGARVSVLERDEIGRGASYGNAGTIAPGHAPINKPGRIRQALKSLFHPVSPLYVAPRFDAAFAQWLWLFSRSCTPRHLEASMDVLGPLGHTTSRLFDELIEQEKLDCGYRREGYYEVYRTARALEAAKRDAGLISRYGYHPEILAGRELREQEPALNREILGGIFYPEAATLNPHRFVVELARRASCRGATFHSRIEVARILTRSGLVQGIQTTNGESFEADAVVVAAGASSTPLLQKLGLIFPLQPAKGYHQDRVIGKGTPALRHACVLGENFVFCTPMDGFVRFAGTLEFSGLNHEIRRPRLEQLTNAAKGCLHGVEDSAACSEWCGLRPCMPDGLPVVSPVLRYAGLYVACGHAMMGLTLAPVTGQLIADCVLDGNPRKDIRGLRLERF